MNKHLLLIISLSVCVLLILFQLVSPFPQDTIVLERYVVNIITYNEQKQAAPLEKSVLPDINHETVVFNLKNYHQTEKNIVFEIICKEYDGQDCAKVRQCSNKSFEFCAYDRYDAQKEAFIVKTAQERVVNGHETVQMLIGITVRDDAPLGRFIFEIIGYIDDQTYAKKTFRINIGQDAADTTPFFQEDRRLSKLYIGLASVSVLLVVLVFLISLASLQRQ